MSRKNIKKSNGILLVEDSKSLAATYQEYLAPLKVPLALAETGREADSLIHEFDPDLVILDVQLPDSDGVELLQKWRESGIDKPVIVISAHGSVDVAVAAMQTGARDFLLKPFDAPRLLTTVGNALSLRALETEVVALRHTYEQDGYFELRGSSLPMQAVYRAI